MINPLSSAATNIQTNPQTDSSESSNAHSTNNKAIASGNIRFPEASESAAGRATVQNSLIPDSSAAQQLQSPQASSSEAIASASNAINNISQSNVTLDISAMAMLLHKLAQDSRTSARNLQRAEAEAEKQSYMDAAQKIRDAANDRMWGAIASGITQITGSLGQLGAGMANARSILAAGDNVTDDLLAKAKRVDEFAGHISKVVTASGKIAQGIQDQRAGIKDAEKAELDLQARMHERANQAAKEQSQQMFDIIRDMRNLIQAENQARKDTRILL